MSKHYFSQEHPATPEERHRLAVTLAGQAVNLDSAPGVFSHTALDKATAILLDQAPLPEATGNFLDLGCGWGPIALSLALHSPQAKVWATDISPRALDLTARNYRSLRAQLPGIGLADLSLGTPDQVLPQVEEAGGLDLIWSNPPVRVGKEALHQLLSTWLPLLKPQGSAILVMGKNLGADTLAKWLIQEGYQVDRLASKKGFRLLAVSK